MYLNNSINGTVAALEELIGNHGGLGGEQTDVFILHPADMENPETLNFQEMMSILKSWVGHPRENPKPERPAEKKSKFLGASNPVEGAHFVVNG